MLSPTKPYKPSTLLGFGLFFVLGIFTTLAALAFVSHLWPTSQAVAVHATEAPVQPTLSRVTSNLTVVLLREYVVRPRIFVISVPVPVFIGPREQDEMHLVVGADSSTHFREHGNFRLGTLGNAYVILESFQPFTLNGHAADFLQGQYVLTYWSCSEANVNVRSDTNVRVNVFTASEIVLVTTR